MARRNDPLLTTAEVAERLGWTSTGAVRSARKRGYLPEPDEPDTETAPNRRKVQWRASTIDKFMASRPGAGYRSDLAAGSAGKASR